jgi:hypothetical protein
MSSGESTAAVQSSVNGSGSPVASRLAELRAMSEKNPEAAAALAWAWINELSQRAVRDPSGADAELNELFRQGTAPQGLDGPSEGILVTTRMGRGVDMFLRLFTTLWIPWQGKRFDSTTNKGDNLFLHSARGLGRVLFPGYKLRDAGDKLAAFDFDIGTEPGKADPDVQVMVIAYSEIMENPRFIIRSIRDELVELVPGAYLGKVLWIIGKEKRVFRKLTGWPNMGFFAVRQPVAK